MSDILSFVTLAIGFLFGLMVGGNREKAFREYFGFDGNFDEMFVEEDETSGTTAESLVSE